MSAAEEYVRRARAGPAVSAQERPGAGTSPAIELRDVWLSFDTPVLRGVNLRVETGEVLLVAGQSGSGKSTILKLIMRLLVPDHGEIYVLGHEITRLSFDAALDIRRRIGMVFQNAALFDSLTVYENVAYPLRENTDLRESEIERVVRERLEFVDLDPDQVMPQLPAELSGGMQKRVGIARAIAVDPEIVLYDEPTAGLDPIAVQSLLRLIRKLQRDLAVTSVLVTHDIRVGLQVATRVNMLREGRIVFDGSPDELVDAEDEFLRAFLDRP